jgi:GTPase
MFIDETTIVVNAGNGGNGCFAHMREKYKPKGSPSGGKGGWGGDVYIEVSQQLRTLQDADYRKRFTAENGAHGQGDNKYGKGGEDLIIQVPLGTVVYDEETGSILCDMLALGQKVLIAKGGKGGLGNANLVSRHNPNPEFAHPGEPGEKKRLKLVLKVLADVGLVGRPNAGKSTLLSVISKAHPKIADYPFTTKEPQLGIVQINGSYESFVVADIPGLIEGSHTGKGLGIRFLKHIERTKVLAVLVAADSNDPQAEANMLIHELSAYSPILAEKPKCFILSKSDLVPDNELTTPEGWYAMSSVTGAGVPEVLRVFQNMLDSIPKE